MSRRTGIIVALDGKTLNDTPLAYSSERSHLLVDTSPVKHHLDILQETGWPSMTVTTTVGQIKETVFDSIAHGLPFIPKVSVKFLARQVPAAMSGFEGTYGSYLYTGGIPFFESISFKVDDERVYFIHRTGSITSSLIQSYTTIMQQGLYMAKYIIFQNEGMDEPYESTFVSF